MIESPENNFQNRKLAEFSPGLVLEGEALRLIDEWQEVPQLWDAVRYEVDKRAEKRHFVAPSLACAVLGVTVERLLGDLETAGSMFEALCVICGMSNAVYCRPDGVYVVPITALKN